MQVEVVVFLLFLFSGVWSVPSLPGIATGFVSDFLHVTLLLGSFFFYLAASRRAKESVSHFSFSTVILRFGTILYKQACIFKRALGAVVSSFRCRGVLSISATLQAAQLMFVRQRSSMVPIF